MLPRRLPRPQQQVLPRLTATAGSRITKKLADYIAERKAAGTYSGDDIDDNDDDDEASDTGFWEGSTKANSTKAATKAAAPPIELEPYFGTTGDPTVRAASLPPLPGFEALRAAKSATAPPLLSSAGQSTARGSSRPGSLSSFITTTPLSPLCRMSACRF